MCFPLNANVLLGVFFNRSKISGLWYQLSFAGRFLLHSVGVSTGQGLGASLFQSQQD